MSMILSPVCQAECSLHQDSPHNSDRLTGRAQAGAAEALPEAAPSSGQSGAATAFFFSMMLPA
jgi:hypothetical protein